MKAARARTVGAALLLGSVLAAGSVTAGEKLAPELTLAGTLNNRPIHLEDLRGQVTVFCFFDDSAS
jgi:hypothetical protein